MLCNMCYHVTCYQDPIISQYLKTWGVDSPVTTQFWKLSLDLKQCEPWRNGLTRLKGLITGQGQYLHGFCFCSQHAQRCSSFIFNFSVCFKLYTQPTTSFNACYTGHMGPQGCCNNFHFHYRCDVSRKIQFMLLLTINENGHFSLYRFTNNGDEDVVANYKYSEHTVKALCK